MILAIDGYEPNSTNHVGIGRFGYEIIRKLAHLAQGDSSPFDSVRVYVPETLGGHMPKAHNKWVYRVVGPKPMWTFLGLPLHLIKDMPRPDVLFTPTHYIPRFVNIPSVMAIMDTSYLLYPDLFRPRDLYKLVHWTAYSARHARRIITISEYSKRAIIEAYHVPESHVVVAYPALPDTLKKIDMTKRTLTKDLPDKYILSVGTLQPRKNYEKLIQAFAKISQKDVHLLIVGKKGWLYDGILAAPKKHGVEDRVKFLDYVSDDMLPELYSNAQCFVLASLYEGFGLPVLEAMSYGAPVVISNVSSLPEIAGDVGIYVDPNDPDSIADGIQKALGEKAKERQTRIEKGKKRTKDFSWDKAAETVMRVLTEVAKERKK